MVGLHLDRLLQVFLVFIVCGWIKQEVEAMKLVCPEIQEPNVQNFTYRSLFNQTNFTSQRPCQRNFSLVNVALEMACLSSAQSGCLTLLRFSWNFETKDAENQLQEVTLNLVDLGSPITINCYDYYYYYYGDEDEDDDEDDDDDDVVRLSQEVFSINFVTKDDCCNTTLPKGQYFAVLSASYLEASSCRVSAQMIPDQKSTASIVSVTVPKWEDVDGETLGYFVKPTKTAAFTVIQASVVVSFFVVFSVVVVIIVYIVCIRRKYSEFPKSRIKAETRRTSAEPLDPENGTEMEGSRRSSFQHNCPHCRNEEIRALFPDLHSFQDTESLGSEEMLPDPMIFEPQFDSGFHSGGPMFATETCPRSMFATEASPRIS